MVEGTDVHDSQQSCKCILHVRQRARRGIRDTCDDNSNAGRTVYGTGNCPWPADYGKNDELQPQLDDELHDAVRHSDTNNVDFHLQLDYQK